MPCGFSCEERRRGIFFSGSLLLLDFKTDLHRICTLVPAGLNELKISGTSGIETGCVKIKYFVSGFAVVFGGLLEFFYSGQREVSAGAGQFGLHGHVSAGWELDAEQSGIVIYFQNARCGRIDASFAFQLFV